MSADELLDACLPYLRTLANLQSCGYAPSMTEERSRELNLLMSEIWELLRKDNNGTIEG